MLRSAPAVFRRLNRGGVPVPALLLTAPLPLTSLPLLYAGGSVIGALGQPVDEGADVARCGRAS
ncbi:hypothetical protein H7H78_04540 [Mycobacterium shinjukuense]|uniref:Uncharacterized protein n=1 Tax=Mycobacterium shinjukuense TaxID=398694 RepID=A0A7I7MM74_9MYCO|nr:hypothetical protein [Mycobacterium shinjukuense]ORB67449.1 hypothetical protein BST45_12410 [Mycobacterium shinjukuense]BBX73374.1 hypothetical protein MSHI_12800 [Mycobacterium shinjukuense]